MARTLIASDNFNRADGAVGANWTQTNTDAGSMSISGNACIPGNSLGTSSMVWAGAGAFSNDQYAKVTLKAIDFGSSNYGFGVTVRSSNDLTTARDNYYFYAGSDNTGELGKVVNGTTTVLGSGTVNATTNDTIALEVVGTTLICYLNDVPLGGSFTQTDSSLSTGKPGLMGRGDSGVAKGAPWEGGDVTAGSSAKPSAYYSMMRR
jgi:hypothetical protein